MSSKDSLTAETLGGLTGALGGAMAFVLEHGAADFQQLGYEVRGTAWALGGLVAVGGLAHVIKNALNKARPVTLAEDVDGPGGY